ncbi:MAG TPA: DNA alkylation repair protein [Methanocella sp.]|jgi:3-methyladenine DNA glycosylase AlkD
MPGVDEIVERLRAISSPEVKDGMVKLGINVEKALGVDTTRLKNIAGELGKDHVLALALWDTGIHEARIIAAWIGDPRQLTEEQMDRWVTDFDSWDLCDHTCWTLFDKTPFAYKKCLEWASDDREYVKRSGFVMMAALAIHDKNAPDETFLQFFPFIVKGASDERNMVKKAVSWALRQTGKRNLALNRAAVAVAEEIKQIDCGPARRAAIDVLRELRSDAVQARLEKWDARKKERSRANSPRMRHGSLLK